MKKNSASSILGFIIFFIVISFNFTVSILVYSLIQNKESWMVSLIMILCILISSLICCGIDFIRRRTVYTTPVNEILAATHKIASGDFNIKLKPRHAYSNYDPFDLIMDDINQMAIELEKNEVLKNDFISNVSHEIKTPIHTILNYANALKDERLDSDTRTKYLNILVQTIKDLTKLVTNILSLNRLEHQRVEFDDRDCNIGELLRQCIIDFEGQIDQKQLKLDCDIEDIICDTSKGYLEIIFKNLISNAIKFTDIGGISISLQRLEQQAVFKITDSGCGISKESGQRIFEKFYQGDTSHSKEGNGLGLALVKQVIDLMGGEIEVQSQLQRGTIFVVRFYI